MNLHLTVPLATIAHGRSGDKGNHANVAIIAYTAAGYAWLRDHLTVDEVRRYFRAAHWLAPHVERYEAPNVGALNSVLSNGLAGGGSRSLRSDTQGKTLALRLLQMPLHLPD